MTNVQLTDTSAPPPALPPPEITLTELQAIITATLGPCASPGRVATIMTACAAWAAGKDTT